MTTITATAAATQAGVTVDTIRTWCRLGAIAARKTAGRWVINTVSLARRVALTARPTTTERIIVSDIQITTEGGKTRLSSPYNNTLPRRARELGGKFDRATKQWVFDARDEERVRELARDIYGTDGGDTAVVDVRVHLDQTRANDRQTLWMFGRQLADRPGRDDRVRLGNGVVIAEGGFDRTGGSVKNPRLDAEDGTVLEVRDVPAGHATLQHDGVEIITSGDDIDRAALEAEKAKLQARLAEINALLGQ